MDNYALVVSNTVHPDTVLDENLNSKISFQSLNNVSDVRYKTEIYLRHSVPLTVQSGKIPLANIGWTEIFNLFFALSDEVVAQFKYTVLLMPSGVNLVTGLPFKLEKYQSEHSITDPELKVSCPFLIFVYQ